MVNHPHRKQRANTQVRTAAKTARPPKTTECFLGVLYPSKRLLWNVGGPVPDQTITQARFIVSRPEFWDGIDTVTDDEFGRAAGRLVEVLADKDAKQHERLINVLALAVIGMSKEKFIWFEVETPAIMRQAPAGKTLEASFNLKPRVLSATTAKAASREFFEVMKVGFAANKMWLLLPHEGEALVKEIRGRK